MNRIKILILFTLLFIKGYGQSLGIQKTWIDVQQKTDSIVIELKSQGIDSIMYYNCNLFFYDYSHSRNETHDTKSTIIIWKNNDTIYFKKINEFFISDSEIRETIPVFDFYVFNKSEIDTTSFSLKTKFISSPNDKFLPASTPDSEFTFYYNIGQTERKISWTGSDLRPHKYFETDYLTSLSSKLFTLIKIVENEINFMNINEIWTPIEIRYYSNDEKKQMVIDWIERTEIQIQNYKDEYNLDKKASN